MAVGFLEIIIGASAKAAIDGMNKAKFAAKEAQKIYEQSAAKINRSIATVGQTFDLISDGAESAAMFAARSLENVDSAAGRMVASVSGGIADMAAQASSSLQVFTVLKDVIGVGITKAAGIFPKMFKSIGFLAGPIGIVTAGLTTLYTVVASNFDAISEGARVATNWFIRLYNNSTLFRVVVESIRTPLEIAFNLIKGIGVAIQALELGQFQLLGPIAEKTFSDIERAQRDAFARMKGADPIPEFDAERWKTEIADPAREFLKIKATITADLESAMMSGKAAKAAIEEEIATEPPKVKLNVFIPEDVAILANLDTQLGKIEGKYSILNDEAARLKDTQKALQNALRQAGAAGIDPQSEAMQRLLQDYENINKQLELLEVNSQGISLPTTESIRNDQRREERGDQAAFVGQAAFESVDLQSQRETAEAVRALNAELIEQQNIISSSEASKQQKAAAQAQIALLRKQIQAEKDKSNALKQGAIAAANAARKEIKANIAAGISSALKQALASVPFPFNIIAATGAGAAAGALFESAIPKFARGGAVFGKTLAVVGDNPNAHKDPELIAPKSIFAKVVRDNTNQGGNSRPSLFEIDGLKLRELIDYSSGYANALR